MLIILYWPTLCNLLNWYIIYDWWIIFESALHTYEIDTIDTKCSHVGICCTFVIIQIYYTVTYNFYDVQCCELSTSHIYKHAEQ